METKMIRTRAVEQHVKATTFSESNTQDLDRLRQRSAELLYKFRRVWNEAEYQEWCTIQRILYKMS